VTIIPPAGTHAGDSSSVGKESYAFDNVFAADTTQAAVSSRSEGAFKTQEHTHSVGAVLQVLGKSINNSCLLLCGAPSLVLLGVSIGGRSS
jgi:hypothetical protein